AKSGCSRRPKPAPLSGLQSLLWFDPAPEAYSRPDRRTAKPSRAAAVQGWRAAPPEGLVLDWREHDGSIGRLGARGVPQQCEGHLGGAREIAPISSGVRRGLDA